MSTPVLTPLPRVDGAPALQPLTGPLGETTCSRILAVSLYTPASPAGPLLPSLHPSLPPCFTMLHSQLPGLFIGPVSFPHLQGGRSCHSGPTEPPWNTARE